MAKIISPKWQDKMREELEAGTEIDVTGAYLPGMQWLIMKLNADNRPYKLYNLGAGVKRVTTNTDTCPCCKRTLPEVGGV